MRTLATIAVLSAILAQTSATRPQTAKDTFAQLQQQAAAASKAGDRQARLTAILKMRALLNDSPDAVEASAEAYLAAGETRQALKALDEFTQQGQSDNSIVNGTDKHFTALHDLPEYKSVVTRMERNTTAIAQAETAFTLSDPKILPEDIAYDPRTKTFFITSVLQRKILRITLDGKVTDSTLGPILWPVMAIKIDPDRNVLWATEVAIDTFASIPKEDRGRSAIVCFDLSTGALIQITEAPRNSAIADMTLATNGDPILADGQTGIIYRVQPDKIKVINTTDFISPQTPAALPDGKHILIPDYVRGIGILDLETNAVTWLHQLPTASSEIPVGLNGIDGLYLDHNTVILTQNGTSPERVIRLHLDNSLQHILHEEIVERSTPSLGDPTHGVIVGSDFYYIANSGWNHLDDNGNIKPDSPLTPAKIMCFHLH
jgi:sugar lactone lactonase YvrE